MSVIQKYVMEDRTESGYPDIWSKAPFGEEIGMLANEAAG